MLNYFSIAMRIVCRSFNMATRETLHFLLSSSFIQRAALFSK